MDLNYRRVLRSYQKDLRTNWSRLHGAIWASKRITLAIHYLENRYKKKETIKLYLYKLYHWVNK